MHAVHDKSHILRLRDGFQFRLPDLSLWNVGLGDFLEYSSGCVDIFSQIINREIEIDVLSFFLPVSLSYHLLNLALYFWDLSIFHDRPRAYLVGSFYLIPLLYRGMGFLPSIMLWWSTHTGSHSLPSPFYGVYITLATVMAIIL